MATDFDEHFFGKWAQFRLTVVGGWYTIALSKTKLPILQKQLSINPYLTLLSKVTYHIPVERGNVQPSGFGVTAAHGDVDGTADLLIVEHIAGCFAYAIVHAEGKFADTSRSLVDVEHTQQEILTRGSMDFDSTALLETQPYVIDRVPIVAGWQSKADGSLSAILDGATKNFTIGEIDVSIAWQKGAILN